MIYNGFFRYLNFSPKNILKIFYQGRVDAYGVVSLFFEAQAPHGAAAGGIK